MPTPQQPAPPTPLAGDPVIGVLLDAGSFARLALGEGDDREHPRRELVLALGYAEPSSPLELAKALRRGRRIVDYQLEALFMASLITFRVVNNALNLLEYRLTPEGKSTAEALRAAAGAATRLADSTQVLISPQPNHGQAHQRPVAALRRRWSTASGTPAKQTAARLSDTRRQAGLTQRELARRAGVALGTIEAMERGTRAQPAQPLVRCCEALGARLVDILVVE